MPGLGLPLPLALALCRLCAARPQRGLQAEDPVRPEPRVPGHLPPAALSVRRARPDAAGLQGQRNQPPPLREHCARAGRLRAGGEGPPRGWLAPVQPQAWRPAMAVWAGDRAGGCRLRGRSRRSARTRRWDRNPNASPTQYRTRWGCRPDPYRSGGTRRRQSAGRCVCLLHPPWPASTAAAAGRRLPAQILKRRSRGSPSGHRQRLGPRPLHASGCLLYTSDAADE